MIGTGKTQFCLFLAMRYIETFQSLDEPIQVIFISCNEGEFPIKRFQQFNTSNNNSTLNNLLIELCYNYESVENILFTKIPELCSRNKKNPVKLIIIDKGKEQSK